MKTARFLLDANISPETAEFLRSLDFDVRSLIEDGLGGLDDSAVVRIASRERRVVITFDLDFGERYYFAAPKKFGVIILRLDDQRVEIVNAVLTKFLTSYRHVLLEHRNRLAIVRETDARII